MAGESQQTPNTEADPTVMAQEAITRSQVAERDYVNGQLDVIRARLNGMDEATKVLHETVTRTPTDIQQAVGHLRELHDEKFVSVAQQFTERDTRSERESRDNKVAVDAAFAAQKESAAAQDAANQKAIDKSEKTTLDTIRQTAAKIDDLKTRVERIENVKQGGRETLAGIYALAAFLAAVLVIFGALAASGVFAK